jgi:hypothetical protein
MAVNTGNGYRKGSVSNRSQTYNPRNDTWVKRNSESGKFISAKSEVPYKGVTKEPDKRR